MSEIETAQTETRLLLDALSDPDPDADEVKDLWYGAGMAIRAAIFILISNDGGKHGG